MDFLMLLPHNVRVVIEVDGKHHYADQSGSAHPGLYAAMLNADRDLPFSGYDVYRFGAEELNGDAGQIVVTEFFERLFRLHKIAFPARAAAGA
jgi:very-short-patch-repair endonuclease